jgi:hypothetical protein
MPDLLKYTLLVLALNELPVSRTVIDIDIDRHRRSCTARASRASATDHTRLGAYRVALLPSARCVGTRSRP